MAGQAITADPAGSADESGPCGFSAQRPPAAAAPAAQEPPVRPDPGAAALSERDRAVLTFEKQHWKSYGAKEQAIRDRFGISATSYFQILNRLLDSADALAFEPAMVKRLRRRRDAHRHSRSAAAAPQY